MATFKSNSYCITSRLPQEEVRKTLKEYTLLKENISVVPLLTDRYFIGNITGNSFEIIEASLLPYGPMCILKGVIAANSEIQISTNVHGAVKIIFYLLLIGLFIPQLFVVKDPANTSTAFVGYLVAISLAVSFWMVINGTYTLARNSAIMKLKILLKAD
jgi:uncharacterized membrane protein YccF (DUF307 family)